MNVRGGRIKHSLTERQRLREMKRGIGLILGKNTE